MIMALQFDPNINIPDNNGRVEKIVVSVDIQSGELGCVCEPL